MAEARVMAVTALYVGRMLRAFYATCGHLPPDDAPGLPSYGATTWIGLVLPLHGAEMTEREAWAGLQAQLAERCGCTIPKHLLEGEA